MKSQEWGFHTRCTHVGELEDTVFGGAVSPLYMSTSYAYEGKDKKRYPRYFNTPNQEALSVKLASLEGAEAALVFGSGMAAVSTALLAFLQQGDHVVFQPTLYGGTHHLITEEFPKYGISFSFAEGLDRKDFEKAIRKETKVLYIETPSNPLLGITDLEMVASLAKEKGLITMIDNTFASPVNQNPIAWGIDVVIHSATKYLGGHSDILAGAVCASQEHIDRIFSLAKNLGGTLSDQTVWLLERSIKTLGLRVKAQNRNAKKVARFLEKHDQVKQVWYPGLKSHPDYALAKKQMKGFGGMMAFELKDEVDTELFLQSLNLIKPSMSLAGVESTMVRPSKTSHALLTQDERNEQGINDRVIRFSVGIEDKKDLVQDLEQAIHAALHVTT